MRKIRLFIEDGQLALGKKIEISGSDFEYLSKVMRQKVGDMIFLFDGVSGEFAAEILSIEKKSLALEVDRKTADLIKVPNITLAFAPVKNVRIDFIAAKATELGVASFQPILTHHTIVDKINAERFKANVKEACEQCERNDFPKILSPKKLENFLNEKESAEKIFILCDESGQGSKASEVLSKIDINKKEVVVLIGPEGGFSSQEFLKMRERKNIFAISLGPRILRADTAMISAMTLVQEFLGDFVATRKTDL